MPTYMGPEQQVTTTSSTGSCSHTCVLLDHLSPLRSAQAQFVDQRSNFFRLQAHLLHRIPLAKSHAVVVQAVAVNGTGEGDAQLVVTRIALANSRIAIVDSARQPESGHALPDSGHYLLALWLLCHALILG